MNTTWRVVLITVVIATICGFIGARFGASRSAPPTANQMQEPTVRQQVDDILRKKFTLTPAQKQTIDAIDERYTRRRNEIIADLHAENVDLAAAVGENMTLSPLAKDAIMEIQDSVGKLQTDTINYILEVRQVLTADQKKAFDEEIVEMMMTSGS